MNTRLTNANVSDLIHAVVVVLICTLATGYASLTKDHSNNIWIVYGSAVAFAAGRAGAAVASHLVGGRREEDPAGMVSS